MTDLERELEELRRYKLENEAKTLTKAFYKLERMIDSGYDTQMSRATFRVICECLMALRDKVEE